MTRTTKLAVAGLLGLLLLAGAAYAGLFALGALPRLGFAPGYTFVDARGGRLTSEDLRGHVVLYTFAPAAGDAPHRDPASVMRAVQDALPEADGEIPLRLVTVILDAPPDALPDALAEAARQAGADPARWHFTAGPPEAVRTAVRDGFGVWYEDAPNGGIAYDPVFVVVDGMGIVRSRHRVGLPPADVLLGDLRSVVREASAATGAARLAYEAAHLFQCYPPR